MSSQCAATSDAIGVLIADSNRMQAQLLTTALRRHAGFRIFNCRMETDTILQAVAAKLPRVVLLSLNPQTPYAETIMILRRFHLSHSQIPKVLLADACDRELVVSAFRSGALAASFPSRIRISVCFASVFFASPKARSGPTQHSSTM